MHIAVENAHLEAVRLLLKAGANANMSRTDTGETTFHLAALTCHEGLINLLVEAGAEVNQARTEDGAPLYVAAQNGHVQVVRVQLVQIETKARTRDGATPVYIACLVGHLNVVQMLVEARVDIDQATTETGATPLYVAAQECRTKIACLLAC